MMDNNSEEPKRQQSKPGQQSQPQQNKSPRPPHIITAKDNDDVDPPFTACNAIDIRDLASLLEKDAKQLDHDTTTSQENNNIRHHESKEGIVIDGPATITPIKKQQPIITSSSPQTTPETHMITTSTVSSTTSSITDVSDLSTIQKAYKKYQQKRKSSLSGGGGTLFGIIEDVQFCAMYFYGEVLDDTSDEDNENNRMSKGDRMKEIDDTFLDKVIQCQCGSIEDSCDSGDYLFSYHGDERDDISE
jgi:hypothetical protein